MSTINTSIFRSYDIRGIYPDEFNEQAAYAIGRAIVKHTGAHKVLVGRDMRLSGESLHKEMVKGVTDAGADAVDAGLIPVDFIYWAVPKHDYGAGVVVTASHNPKEYNGCKMVGKAGEFIRGTDLLGEVQALYNDGPAETVNKGTVTTVDYWNEYIKHILSFVDRSKLKKLKIVVDAGNGMAGKVIPHLARNLPVEFIPLFFELDGHFPNRPPNPLTPGALDQLKAKVVEIGADCGVAYDADTDRLFFVDEKGQFVQADITLLILAKYWLEREPGAGISYNLICSKAVPEIVTEWGGRPLRSAVGYVNVRKAMRDGNGVMGGEVSAHYSFRDNYYADSGYIALVIFLQILSQSGKPLSELVKGYARYVRGDEINFKVDDQQAVLDLIEAQYHDAKIDKIDGITFEYKKWWFNARPSNTEPLLRITVEAETEKMMEKKREEIQQLIESIQK